MEYDIGSTVIGLHNFQEQISTNISIFKECLNGENNSDDHVFQFSENIPDYHHQETVETSFDPPCANSTDYDLLETNDLFSFILENRSTESESIVSSQEFKNTLASAFSNSLEDDYQPSSPNLNVPLDLLNILDTKPQKQSETRSDVSIDMESFNSNSVDFHASSSSDKISVSQDVGNNYFEMIDSFSYEENDFTSNYSASCSLADNPSKTSSVFLHNEDLLNGKAGQLLVLSEEEKRLLTKMGQPIPTTFPLTRTEERFIRTARRKIRNKLSAKASRVRRQDYLVSIESRISVCNKENQRLRNQIYKIEKEKSILLASLRQMRSYVARIMSGMPSIINCQYDNVDDILPVTIHPKKSTLNNDRPGPYSIARSTASGTGLLLIAFMILAWATVMPIPELDSVKLSEPSIQSTIAKSSNVFSGHSRMLLLRENIETSEGINQDSQQNKLLKSIQPMVESSKTDLKMLPISKEDLGFMDSTSHNERELSDNLVEHFSSKLTMYGSEDL